MATIETPGEPLEDALPADVKSIEFQGIKAYRIVGTKVQLMETTDILSRLYRGPMTTLGDAIWLGQGKAHPQDEKKWDDIYELIVLRKVNDGPS